MKRLSIFVLPLLLAISCSKQEIPEAMSEEQLSFGVSLTQTDSKTVLGPLGEGKYPTLWQTGDRISLNGFPSLELSSEQAGGSKASFVFRGGLSSPFNILYPASACDTVTFLEKQSYTAGSFDPEATPMWASTIEYQDVSLRHLSSLLRFDIKGTATLKQMAIMAEGDEAISGQFTMDKDAQGLYTGEITPLQTKSSLVLDFGTGLNLKESEATPIYVAIPAGNYGEGFKSIISTTDNKVMIISFFTKNGKNIAPSKVLHFDEFTFSDGGDDVLYIFTAEDLVSLATSKATKAYLMADIDLSATTWTAISAWSGKFDGMGHSITGNGTTTPLFLISETSKAMELSNLTLSGMPLTTMSGSSLAIDKCQFGDMTTRAIGVTGGNLTIRNSKFSGNVTSTSYKSISMTSGNLTVSNTEFSDNGTKATAGVVAGFSGCSGSTISFDECLFRANKNNANGGMAMNFDATFSGKVYINNCIFRDNMNGKFGCISTNGPTADNGAFIGVNNCLFYDNRSVNSSSTKVVESTDLNLAVRHLVINSTFISTKNFCCTANFRCGSMSLYTGGAKGSMMVNNIFVNEYKDGHNFTAAAANKYYQSLVGYNRYNIGENSLYGGVSYKTTDIKAETSGSLDESTLVWTWNPDSADKAAMFSGSGQDLRKYIAGNADKEWLYGYVTEYFTWLNSLNAFDKDLYGNPRTGERVWPGCYQGE